MAGGGLQGGRSHHMEGSEGPASNCRLPFHWATALGGECSRVRTYELRRKGHLTGSY